MHTDAHFAIGKTHDVCQDYAVAGQTDNGLAYAIVSDGCSSSPRTDFGARFLAAAAQADIHTNESMPDGRVVANIANSARRVLGLPQTCLDATLIIATMSDKVLQASMWGDGEIVILRETGFEWITVDYAHGAPRYLTYSLNPDREAVYVQETEDGRRLETVRGSRSRDTLQGSRRDAFGRSPFELFVPIDAVEGIRDVRGVMLFSDGLQTFQDTDRGNEGVSEFDVLDQVLALKNLKGEYLKRRCKKFLGKYCRDNSWQHADDFSVAGIMR